MNYAVLAALSYWIIWVLDNMTGVQTLSRPIIIGTFTGLLCGDIKTGIILGATLEAVFLGIVGVGGVSVSDPRSSTVIAVALAIGSGLDLEAALAIAVTIAALMNIVSQFARMIENMIHPFFMKLAENGEYRKFRIMMYLDLFILKAGIPAAVVLIFVAAGSTAAQTVMENLPAFVLTGINASGNMLVVVGLALMAQSIWSPITGVLLLLGFILSMYLGLNTVVIAAIGFIIAYLVFVTEMNKKKELPTMNEAVTANENMEDDFYD
ncbi:PTS sugar transporter subunit IIC [Dielma fastidiosa]|uniref:PTS sugar transporter subunit IIC n=1 Tax=Dielma fastidiosa TaxID=1034346 RepID=A0AB35UIR8_9FIRM|nr:PTS sugar transporter subunit IIC [Dielma fastidiosa]MDY5167685.1 PTS sugar transporter subunit IIC [Dielma fastidiosa]